MRFSVKVPVLSLQSTVMAPSVSMALMRRVSTPCLDNRRAPSAGNTVRTTGYSSKHGHRQGDAGQDGLEPVTLEQHVQQHQGNASAMASSARLRTSIAVCFCSGDKLLLEVLEGEVDPDGFRVLREKGPHDGHLVDTRGPIFDHHALRLTTTFR